MNLPSNQVCVYYNILYEHIKNYDIPMQKEQEFIILG